MLQIIFPRYKDIRNQPCAFIETVNTSSFPCKHSNIPYKTRSNFEKMHFQTNLHLHILPASSTANISLGKQQGNLDNIIIPNKSIPILLKLFSSVFFVFVLTLFLLLFGWYNTHIRQRVHCN